MIFRYLEKRRMRKLFGEFMSSQELESIWQAEHRSEWNSFLKFVSRFNINKKHKLEDIRRAQEQLRSASSEFDDEKKL